MDVRGQTTSDVDVEVSPEGEVHMARATQVYEPENFKKFGQTHIRDIGRLQLRKNTLIGCRKTTCQQSFEV